MVPMYDKYLNPVCSLTSNVDEKQKRSELLEKFACSNIFLIHRLMKCYSPALVQNHFASVGGYFVCYNTETNCFSLCVSIN